MATEQVVEEVADQIEEVAEATRKLTGREVGFFFSGMGIGVAVGFGIGMKILEKRISAKYNKISEETIQEMRDHYNKKIVAAKPKPDLDEAIQPTKNEEILIEERYSPEELQAIEETNAKFPPEPSNIFENQEDNDDQWDYSQELKTRSSDRPYIIHIDEFNQNDPEHEQTELTYYDEDGVVVDSRDQPVQNVHQTLGLDNLQRFGHGSGNPYLVYIRNEELSLDIEVNKAEGSFTEMIQGIIKHSEERHRRIKRRFGFDDERSD